MSRLRLVLAYHGAGFHGFAPSPGVRTVGGVLAEALGSILGHPVELTCAGRTDAGVHAWGQVAHLDTLDPEAGTKLDLTGLQRSLNRMLAPSIVVREAELAPDHFDARRSAIARRYRYTVLNRELPDPFLAETTWHVEDRLDVSAMQEATRSLLGEHDWSSFCRKPPNREASMVRVVRAAAWDDLGDSLLRFDIEAGAFCHQMVRSVVGTLVVAVGRGKVRPEDMAGIIEARDRSKAASPAPPHGLCLWEVLYA